MKNIIFAALLIITSAHARDCDKSDELKSQYKLDFEAEMKKLTRANESVEFNVFRAKFRLPLKYNFSYSFKRGLALHAKINAYEFGSGIGFVEIEEFNADAVKKFSDENESIITKKVNNLVILSGYKVLECNNVLYKLLVYDGEQIMLVTDENKALVDYIKKQVAKE